MTIRTRFAPSPTGFLHIGGARTALYSWLYAKHHQGQFILRIEDTDQARSTEASTQAILDGMAWLGLDADEGPFYQSQRFERYQTVVQDLLAAGKAYKCYCSKDRLEALRASQLAAKQKPRYDGRCRSENQSSQAPYVIRFKNPTSGVVQFDDLVRGPISVSNEELDDVILARTDGTPTYNFTVVVDDVDMRMTHILRGDDHISNTPRQLNIMAALGAKPPVYGHMPMILGPDGKRLSKRHGAVSVLQYQAEGYLPEALTNYLLRLGWSHGDQEIFSRKEMIALFDGSHINRAAAAFNEDKLQWLNQHYMKSLPLAQVSQAFVAQCASHALSVDLDQAQAVVSAQLDRCKTLKEMADKSAYFFTQAIELDPEAAAKCLTAEAKPVLNQLLAALTALKVWDKAEIHGAIQATAEAMSVKMGKVAQPLRVAVTGGTVSPSIDLTLVLLGRDKSLARLKAAIDGLPA